VGPVRWSNCKWAPDSRAHIKDLRLSDDPADVEDLGDGITATRLLPDTHLLPGLWKIDGYTQTTRVIQNAFLLKTGNYFEFAYDWRRDCRVAAKQLARKSHAWLQAWRQRSGKKDAKLILIAHSMGGLIARHFLEVLDGWRSTRALITFGTPYRGSLNALSFLSNGFAMSVGSLPLVDLSEALRSFTSLYQLLPIYPCYDPGDGRLVRTGEVVGIPGVDANRAAAALNFHREIERAVVAHREDLYRKIDMRCIRSSASIKKRSNRRN